MNRTIMITTFVATLPSLPLLSGQGSDRRCRSTPAQRLQWVGWWLGCVSAVGSLGVATSVQAQMVTSNPLPPPPVTFGTPLQSAPPPAAPGAEYDFRAPRPVAPTYTPPNLPTYTAPATYQPGRYMVFVNGNSPMLLDQVKRVEPGAFLRSLNGSTIIQAGRFAQVANARVRISELESMGIGARIAQVPGDSGPGMAPPPPSTSAPVAPAGAAPSGLEAPMADGSKGYFVVIPGTEAELSSVANQISQMGLGSGVRQGNNPYGPHIAVGPFGKRDAAESWQRYLRSNGLKNARVFFQR